MPPRNPVTTNYRGRTYHGEWYIEDAVLHVICEYGTTSEHVSRLGFGAGPLPSATAEAMLWGLLRQCDPGRPWIDWGRWLEGWKALLLPPKHRQPHMGWEWPWELAFFVAFAGAILALALISTALRSL